MSRRDLKKFLIPVVIVILVIALTVVYPGIRKKRFTSYFTSLLQQTYANMCVYSISEDPNGTIEIDKREMVAAALKVDAEDVECDPCMIKEGSTDYDVFRNYRIVFDEERHSVTVNNISSGLECSFEVDEAVVFR